MRKHEELIKISDIIRENLGLNFTANRLIDLERGLLASAKEIGINETIESIYQWISSTKLSKTELQVLSSHLTVGETYFFREKTSLDLFIKVIIPELIINRKSYGKHIRIWCAGCSSGEEPYSLAILLRENFPELEKWNITIAATDINPLAIKKAISGEYTDWSFRETPQKIKEKYFTQKHKHWTISSEISKMVKFSYLNLIESNYPSSLNNTENLDIVFCRNVFIYLSPAHITEVSKRIFDSLIEGGWFITSQVELNDLYFNNFVKYPYENNFFYRRIQFDNNIAKTSIVNNTSGIKKSEKKSVKKRILLKKEQIKPIRKSSLEENSESPLVLNAKIYADKGEHEKAISIIKKIIESGSANEDIYYLYGTILFEQGKVEDSIVALKKGLYINPHNISSNLMLGNILGQNGKGEMAKKYCKHVLTLLEEWNEDEIIPESGGLTKGRVQIMVEHLLSLNNDEKR